MAEPFYVGVITDFKHTTDVNKFYYSGFDVGFYLNKNKVIKQFKTETNILKAIKDLCLEYEIKTEKAVFPKFKASVKKIYKNITFADVIKDLLKIEKDKSGLKDLYIDCKNGVFNIRQYQVERNLNALVGNGYLISSDKTYSNVETKKSFQNLKNRVLISDNKEKNVRYKYDKDNASINTYGLLTEVVTVDSSKKVNYQQLATENLKELNRVKEEISLSLLGDYRISKGKLIDFTINDYGLNGVYLVKSATHTIDDKEIISVSLEKRNP